MVVLRRLRFVRLPNRRRGDRPTRIEEDRLAVDSAITTTNVQADLLQLFRIKWSACCHVVDRPGEGRADQLVETCPRLSPTIRAISATLTTVLVLASLAPYMLQPFCGQLPQPGSVFVDQPARIKNCSVTSDTVLVGRPRMVEMTFSRAGPSARIERYFRSTGPRPMSSICSSRQARSKVRDGDGVVPLAATNTTTGLQQSEGNARRATRSWRNERQDFLVHFPIQSLATMPKQRRQVPLRCKTRSGASVSSGRGAGCSRQYSSVVLRSNVKSAMGMGWGDLLLVTKMLFLSTAKYKAV